MTSPRARAETFEMAHGGPDALIATSLPIGEFDCPALPAPGTQPHCAS
jgi:hypothetical protein